MKRPGAPEGRTGNGPAGPAISAERVASVLEERARQLARPAATAEIAGAPTLVSFFSAGEHYGVDSRRVLEIGRVGHLVPLPRSEPWVAGLTSWRGALVLVIDLRLLLGAPGAPRPERPAMIVLGGGRALVAVLADSPGELLPVASNELRPAPEVIGGRAYIRGMRADAVLVLDVDRVLGAVAPETE
jgi:purine-binding chemotaxis protein CheW